MRRPGVSGGGFTLLEIILVAAIVAVLLILGFSGVMNLQKLSRETQCASNLRQVGAALFAYIGEHNGQVPPRNLGTFRDSKDRPPEGQRAWHARLINFGYMKESDAFFCPSFFPRRLKDATKTLTEGLGGGETYAIRMWTAPGTGWGDNREEHQPLNAIREPGDFFLLVDSVWTNPQWKSQGYGIVPDSPEQFAHLRHRGKANTFFADGHVERKGPEYFADLGLPNRQADYTGGKNRVYNTIVDPGF